MTQNKKKKDENPSVWMTLELDLYFGFRPYDIDTNYIHTQAKNRRKKI